MLTKDDIEEMSRGEMITRIMELQEQKKYSAFDLDEFAEWCVYHCIRYNGGWIFKYAEISSLNIKTTSQLRELWEVETGRKEEADISVKQKCPECGDESYNSDGNYCLNSDCRLFFI